MDEFGVIQQYFIHSMSDHPLVRVGPGDDCAVLQVPTGCELCVSTDTLLSGVHFPIDANPELIVDRAFGANLSDLAAMGAKPFSATMALTLPRVDHHWLQTFSDAVKQQVAISGMPIVGGNISKGSLSITLNVMGVVPRGCAILRAGASPGESLYVTGSLGDAAAGLKQLLDKIESSPLLLDRYKKPIARIDVGEKLKGVATAAIDISDGFISDLNHLCQASGVGAEIDLNAVPLSVSLRDCFALDACLDLALCGGDDYELCFTAAESMQQQLAEIAIETGVNITKVGKTIDQCLGIVDLKGKDLRSNLGYKHFL